MREPVASHLPEDLLPGGAKAGWWCKTVRLDLEAKGVIAIVAFVAVAAPLWCFATEIR